MNSKPVSKFKRCG